MGRWVVSFPCWGRRYREASIAPLLTILGSLREAGAKDVIFIINTDDPNTFIPHLLGHPFDFRFYTINVQVTTQNVYQVFSDCHQLALDTAREGDRVILLCGDMSVSRNTVSGLQKIFDSGKKKVVITAASPVKDEAPFLDSKELLEWSLDHLAPIAKDLFWRKGRSTYPWTIYFEHKEGVVMHGFHLHCLAIEKKEGLTLEGNTCDTLLAASYSRDQAYLVTKPEELAIVARTPEHKRLMLGRKVGYISAVSWATNTRPWAQHLHTWQFRQQIVLKGKPYPYAERIADRVASFIEWRWRNEAARKAA